MIIQIIKSERDSNPSLDNQEIASLSYHNIFDYPLTAFELGKWKSGPKAFSAQQPGVSFKNGFYFLEGREEIIYKRLLREKTSKEKLTLARKYGRMLRMIPTIKLIAVTGTLAMQNADEESDIDLMIITKKGTLWTTRLTALFLVDLLGIPRRKYGDKNEKDKLCLNMWLDETDLVWSKDDRNIYTAHEICQIIPLINKDKTFEKFIYKNKWILDWWPNAVKVQSAKFKVQSFPKLLIFNFEFLIKLIEQVAFGLQYFYMKSKMTREVVTKTRALFHPVDWGKVVLSRLGH